MPKLCPYRLPVVKNGLHKPGIEPGSIGPSFSKTPPSWLSWNPKKELRSSKGLTSCSMSSCFCRIFSDSSLRLRPKSSSMKSPASKSETGTSATSPNLSMSTVNGGDDGRSSDSRQLATPRKKIGSDLFLSLLALFVSLGTATQCKMKSSRCQWGGQEV